MVPIRIDPFLLSKACPQGLKPTENRESMSEPKLRLPKKRAFANDVAGCLRKADPWLRFGMTVPSTLQQLTKPLPLILAPYIFGTAAGFDLGGGLRSGI